MDYLHYKAKCQESDALYDEVTQILDAAKAHRTSLTEKWKPDGFGTMGERFCLGFNEKQHKEKWLKHVGTILDDDGNEEYYLYRGHNSYKMGKELNADLAREKCNPNWQEYIARKIGAICWVVGGNNRMYTQRIGFSDDHTLLVAIPIGYETEKAVSKLPKWLVKIKKSEFYALNGE